ncbi:MAG TPA: Gfo/Idh/MocA family oxidoreductase [Dehalococcoidia bacterium]|nr:Gfo/Idh/MocA family oxidoreductase [Dehalococcoidia bacterium]
MASMQGKLGIAVIGLGRIGESHLDGLRQNGDKAYIAAVVDIDEARAKASAERYQTKYYLSIDEALNDPSVQAAVVCLPHHLHKPVSIRIMEAGRHVLVEKPWAISSAEGKEMLAKAQEKGVVLMAGQSFRFMWAMWEAKQRVMRGEIGAPFNLLYIFAAPFTRDTAPPWWQDEEKTGGMAFTMYGAHTIDYTLWIYEGRKPVRVYAEARSINPDFEGMDEITITMRFDDDSMATNILSVNTRPTKHECLIVGPKGRIDVILRGGHVPGQLVGVFSGDLLVNGELVESDSPRFHQFAAQMREFISAISERREPIVRYAEMLTQLSVIEAAKKSAAIHQPVVLS